jgi:anti-sigma factor RsiW
MITLGTVSDDGRAMVNCRQAIGRLGEYLDQNLVPGECEEITAHLRRCPTCVVFSASYQRTTELCRCLLAREAPASLTARVLEFVRRHGRDVTCRRSAHESDPLTGR